MRVSGSQLEDCGMQDVGENIGSFASIRLLYMVCLTLDIVLLSRWRHNRGSILLSWFSYNPSRDNDLHYNVLEEIIHS